jgi:3-oxoacyl-[acyl-carrier-protein] synthase-3
MPLPADSRAAVRKPSRQLTPPTAPRVRPVGIVGLGSYAPDEVLTNADLEKLVDTSDAWIQTRTGIRERRRAGSGQATSDLAIAAAGPALAAAGLAADAVELIVVATATPDQITPSTASHVQRGLGATRAAGFDLNAACSGFVTALATAGAMVASGGFGNALVIGADVLTSITDYEERESCVLFGDAAGAVVLAPSKDKGELLDHILGQDGRQAELIQVVAGGSRRPSTAETVAARQHYLRMQGREVFRFAVGKLTELVETIVARNGLELDDVKLLVPHQANRRILDASARALGFGPERVMVNVDRYGNTSNASIPLALDEAVQAGRLQSGDYVVLVAFGGGLTWGASLVRW